MQVIMDVEFLWMRVVKLGLYEYRDENEGKFRIKKKTRFMT